MGTMLIFPEPGRVEIEAYPERELAPDEVRLRTLYSGISAGTELSQYRGTNPYLQKRWEPARRLFLPAEQPSQEYPLRGFGYEEVGEVIETGSAVTGVHPGQIVYGIWGHRSSHIVTEEYAARRILPGGLDPVLGIFSHIGPVALNGVHDAGILIGETVAIFGLGVPGQIVAQLAKRSGARVVGVDLIDRRLELARSLGAVDLAVSPRAGSPAEKVKELTGGLGADVSIEVSGSPAALNEAIRATAYSSRVVALGFFQGEARGLHLGEEFHHNRINLVCSQISGSAPQISHRWNRERLVRTVMALQADGTLNLRPLITQTFPMEQAAEAYRLLDQRPEEVLQVALDFSSM
jgi:2-desacetyl-2-hydroxyethyl bacteriochlorophyllide A dehydrogenase